MENGKAANRMPEVIPKRYLNEYVEGRWAYDKGMDMDDCPYLRQGGLNHRRYYWHRGFLDKRHEGVLCG